jgi:alkanesulfonate monooxygenase SsuD/methylene tetrahydromethanopterin reductase-like flavin-dependent oxidoreductase (luciferase family)
MALKPLFGANVDPNLDSLDETFERTRIADENGLDLVTIQDHPYNWRFLDTWTLLTTLAARTSRVHLGTNVANLPLRPPAMLAKQAASLDVLSGGRVELGIGAGAFWEGVTAFGGPERTPGEAYGAFDDALHILRGLWDNAGRSFTYRGEFYAVQGARPGPAPAHRIPIWVGASGPKMLRLTGRMADGLLVSTTYHPKERLPELNRLVDEGAAEAGRSTESIRRGYNLMGIVDIGQYGGKPAGLGPGVLYGTPKDWVNMLGELYHTYRQDTFLFWPVGDRPLEQLTAFAKDIAPAVRETLERSEHHV